MRRLITFAAAGALLAGTAGGARAQGLGPSTFDLGIYAGGAYTSNWLTTRTVTLNGTPTPTENDDGEGMAPGLGGAFGAQATFWITPALGIRAHGAYLPMQLPDGGGDGAAAPENDGYVVNTWAYDLGFALRPFASRMGGSGLMSSFYLFAGGGGLTVDLAGEDRPLCEPSLLALGACLSFAPEQATVGQGTAGIGFDLVPLGSVLALFTEAAVHVYDSPIHADDFWVGPVVAPAGSTVRVADDAVAVTGRLVLGLKAMFGRADLTPPVEPPPPPPPPVRPPPPPPPPPIDTHHDIAVCVLRNGALENVRVEYNTRSGDTTYQGRPLGEAFPTNGQYAAAAAWFIDNEPITVNGRRYVKYGLPRILGVSELTRAGEYMGVPVFAEAGAQSAEVVYVPVRPGCEFQPYQLEVKTGGVRGD